MTLSPVFRSDRAVRLLAEHGIWERMTPALELQRKAVDATYRDLEHVIGGEYRAKPGEGSQIDADDREGDAGLTFLQDYFFLTLFVSVFRHLGIAEQRLPFYARLNFCIKGIITAADNLFDGQDKSLLPLSTGVGSTYRSIMQLMCFERLMRRTGDDAVASGLFAADDFQRAMKAMLDMLARIGRLEGSEEEGVDEIPTPERMIDQVHRVRGGMLFGLAFCAPGELETGETLERVKAAQPAVEQLGTAFQIVDDLTDFEFDLVRRSHNLLVSQAHHHGTTEERSALGALRASELAGGLSNGDLVQTTFVESARAVLDRARAETRQSLTTLAELGFWFPPELADEVVHAIVGLDGVARMDALLNAENVQHTA